MTIGKSLTSAVLNYLLAPLRFLAKLAALRAGARQSPIVPPQSVAGTALIAVIAIMTFLACIALAAVTMVFEQARLWDNDVSSELTIQIRPEDGVDMEQEIAKAVALTRQAPGIAAVTALSEADSAALLEPWLGSGLGEGLSLGELPIPRLIVVEIESASALNISSLRVQLEAGVAGVTLDDHGVWITQLQRIANVTIATGIGIFLLVLVATCLSVVFATRGAMAGNQTVIAVLHFVGALNSYIAREFQGRFLLISLKGGLLGTLAASLFFIIGGSLLGLLEGPAGGSPFQALFGGFSLTPLVFFGFLFVLILVCMLIALTTRITVEKYLSTLQ